MSPETLSVGLFLFLVVSVNLIVGDILGRLKGREGLGAFLGLFLGPLGWFIMLFFETPSGRCPQCREVIYRKPQRCPHCQAAIG